MQAPNENMAQYEPGEALDRLVATKLNLPYVVATGGVQHKMRYSTDIADAWLVVEKMLREGYQVDIGATHINRWYAAFRGERMVWVDGASAPEAICKAALAALEEG